MSENKHTVSSFKPFQNPLFSSFLLLFLEQESILERETERQRERERERERSYGGGFTRRFQFAGTFARGRAEHHKRHHICSRTSNRSRRCVLFSFSKGRDSKKKVDLNKMDASRIEVAGRENTVAGSKVVVARTVADASKKGIDTGKKRKDKKARIEPKEKKAAVIPTVNKPKEAAHGSTIEDSDDDFDNPPWKKTRSGAGPQVIEKTQRPADASSSKDSKTRKRPTTVKNYIPLSDGKLTLRLALKHMGELMESLNENQRGAVRNIGFGSILSFRMGPIPSTMSWWLVNNYDTKTRVLNCGSHHIQITEELVHDVFGVPRGNEEMKEVERARADFHEVVTEWKGQFESAHARLTPVQFKTYMQGQKASGRIFVLNFLLFYNTLLGETTTNSSINMKFLPALHRGKDIRSFNWCEYMIRCLDRTVETWTPKEPFLGPMPLLLLCSKYIYNFLNHTL